MDIKKLKHERAKLQLKIKDWHDKGKNAKELVYRFHEIQDELQKLGYNVGFRADYFKKEYWDNFVETPKPEKVKKEKPKPKPTKTVQTVLPEPEEQIKPLQDSFILCLAWSASLQNETPEQVTKVMEYFSELGLPIIDESVGEIDSRMEHVKRYEFNGTEDSFRMLKMCTQFVLDAFAKTDFEKFNIAIYGKRKKY